MRHLIPRIEYPELIIGLVSPIGTNLHETKLSIKDNLIKCGYDVHEIHVTDAYKKMVSLIPPEPSLEEKPLNKRYETYIKYGNYLRSETKDASILAALAIQTIVEKRLVTHKEGDEKFARKAYILDQFKRPEEIDLLRSVYGKTFFQVSVYSKRSSRVDALSRRFAEDAFKPDHLPFRSEAEELVGKDENESKEPYGQRITKIFHDADFIINKDAQDSSVEHQTKRFIDLLFSSNTITPTKIEYGMFAAKAAALRTSDLSRQVGAAIFSNKGEIIAQGSNEVPKAGGGTYWPDDRDDDREFKRKSDSNDKRKKEIIEEILKILDVDISKLDQNKIEQIDDSSIMDALEYGRIVHAEMSAISDAARLNGSLHGTTLFSTTFPCHMCAKHIVASGIKRVIYLEPYPKSLASRLHSDSILIEGQDRGEYNDFPYVEFSHFYGITPRRYREFFERSKRKDKHGLLEEFIDGKKRPFINIKAPFYYQLEEIVLRSLKDALTT